MGFSNGANIAVALLLRHPRLVRAAIPFAPMVPLEEPAVSPTAHQREIRVPGRVEQRLRGGGLDHFLVDCEARSQQSSGLVDRLAELVLGTLVRVVIG